MFIIIISCGWFYLKMIWHFLLFLLSQSKKKEQKKKNCRSSSIVQWKLGGRVRKWVLVLIFILFYVYVSEIVFLHGLLTVSFFYLSVPRRTTRRRRNISSIVESEELNTKPVRPMAGKLSPLCSLVLLWLILLKQKSSKDVTIWVLSFVKQNGKRTIHRDGIVWWCFSFLFVFFLNPNSRDELCRTENTCLNRSHIIKGQIWKAYFQFFAHIFGYQRHK